MCVPVNIYNLVNVCKSVMPLRLEKLTFLCSKLLFYNPFQLTNDVRLLSEIVF